MLVSVLGLVSRHPYLPVMVRVRVSARVRVRVSARIRVSIGLLYLGIKVRSRVN